MQRTSLNSQFFKNQTPLVSITIFAWKFSFRKLVRKLLTCSVESFRCENCRQLRSFAEEVTINSSSVCRSVCWSTVIRFDTGITSRSSNSFNLIEQVFFPGKFSLKFPCFLCWILKPKHQGKCEQSFLLVQLFSQTVNYLVHQIKKICCKLEKEIPKYAIKVSNFNNL